MANTLKNDISRRCFVRSTSAAAIAVATAGSSSPEKDPTSPELHEARFYDKLDNNEIQCGLCPWNCSVENRKRGKCGVRENRDGKYYTLVYGRPCSIHNDPIEKKPFFHVYPGSTAFSIATVGCNMKCKFCQNWEISQAKPENFPMQYMSPSEIANLASKSKSKTIAYTYTEPTIFFEYMTDCARAARDMGIGNVMVSNGFIEEKPLKELCSLMTAIKIDLKAFTQQFYGSMCSGRLNPVLNTLKRLSESGTWFEIVVLLIPTLNDNMDEIKRMSEWIVKELGPNVPLHFTRFQPSYKMQNLPPTPPSIMNKAKEIAMGQGCNFVYGGNMPGIEGEDTYCPKCKTKLIDRHGNTILTNNLKAGKCPKCTTSIPGVWI